MEFKDLPPDQNVGKYFWNHQAFLGQGAFGKNKQELLAIKKMDMIVINKDTKMKESLQNEIKALKILNGRHTCGLIQQYQTKRNVYLVQPFCDGGDFRSYLNKNVKIEEKDAIKILKDLLLGIQEMNTNNLAHRDLKPENIFIKDNSFVVADFGFSVQTNPGELMNDQCGTPLYMSPQILEGSQYSSKCDVWALGMIYYETLFGKTPWNVQDFDDLIQMPREVPIKFPYSTPISDMSKNFILGCLAFYERDRLSWDQIFQQEIFTNTSEFKPREEMKLSLQLQRIFMELQAIIQRNKLNLRKIFNNFTKTNEINSEQFTKMLNIISNQVDLEEVKKVIKYFDKSNDMNIQFEEFNYMIMHCEYGMEETENQMLEDIKANKVIKNLQTNIRLNHIDINQMFDKLDSSKDGNLNINEIKILVKSIDNNLSQKEIELVFNKFDKDKSGEIELNEFKEIINKGLEEDLFVVQNQEKYQKNVCDLLNKLKTIINNNNSDLEVLFQQFDLSGNQSLELNEFTKLVRGLYREAEFQDISDLFNYIDNNGDNKVVMKEFEKLIE